MATSIETNKVIHQLDEDSDHASTIETCKAICELALTLAQPTKDPNEASRVEICHAICELALTLAWPTKDSEQYLEQYSEQIKAELASMPDLILPYCSEDYDYYPEPDVPTRNRFVRDAHAHRLKPTYDF